MLKPEQQTVLNMITARIRGVKFTSPKQVMALKAGVAKELDKIAMDMANKKQVASNKAARDKQEKVAYRAPFRDAWCRAYLRNDMAVRTTGTKTFAVELIDIDHVVLNDGKKSVDVQFADITKVVIDGAWKDTYEMAAKGC